MLLNFLSVLGLGGDRQSPQASMESAVARGLRAIALASSFILAFGAGAAPADLTAPASASTAAPVLEVFVREGCPHCAAAKAYLAQFARERPALRIVYRPVDQDPEARDALNTISRNAGVWPPGVPTFVYAGRVMVGWDEGEHAGRYLQALLDKGSVPAGRVESKLFGTLSASDLGLPLFTLAIGLLDGFNPCAMWILLFLLSLLVRLQDRKRMALIAGTFVLVGGAVYYAFMAAWLNIFLAVGLSDTVRWILGVTALIVGAINVKDFVAWGHGPSLSIPPSVKPGLYARVRQVIQAPGLPASLLAVATLAVVVNFVELLCTAGFPAIYTAVLAQQQLDALAHYAYLLLYILGYIADDSLMVAMAVIALGSGKLTERAGRWLKFISGAVMLVLGGILLLRPEWLV